MLTFNIITLFPEFFTSALSTALLGQALAKNLVKCNLINPRDYTQNKYRHLDDSSYGGGPGMVMQAEPLFAAINAIKDKDLIINLSPSGQRISQNLIAEWATSENITLICGRYEGIDQRLLDALPIVNISLGDFILNGGEVAALSIIEAVSRLMPGFMGKIESNNEESFAMGLLEYPHYTRPENWQGYQVPSILLSGDHQKIATWRRKEALKKTLELRPDLLATAPLTYADNLILSELVEHKVAKNLFVCLLHHPVFIDQKTIGTSSLTNLDIHDIARISCSYGLGAFYVATPLLEQRALLQNIIRHWQEVANKSNPDRAKAFNSVRAATTLEAVLADILAKTGQHPYILVSSANWPEGDAKLVLNFQEARALCKEQPVLLCLGTARGLAPSILEKANAQIRPIRSGNYNHLSVRSACAIIIDRILGDYD